MSQGSAARKQDGAGQATAPPNRGKDAGNKRKHPVRTWVIGAVVAGLGLGITGLVTRAFDFGTNAAGGLIHQLLPTESATSHASASSSAPATPAGAAVGTYFSAVGVEHKVVGDLVLSTAVLQGFGGCPGGDGYVYPSKNTPGLSTSVEPGTGPRHDGKTWDEDPAAFGAVPGSPTLIDIYLSGSSDRAVTIVGLKFHVISRKPQVHGPWLEVPGQCGGGTTYHYAAVDLDAPPPYFIPNVLPTWENADVLKFPFTASASDPEPIQVSVRTEKCDCTWNATLSWVGANGLQSKVINDNGHPFETTAVTGMKQTEWVGSPDAGYVSSQGHAGYPTWEKDKPAGS